MNKPLQKLSFLALICLILPHAARTLDSESPLTVLVKQNAKPWLNHEANSEQRQPFYIGASPRQIEQGEYFKNPVLRTKLKKIAENQLPKLLKNLELKNAEVEAWPFLDDNGDEAWAFARYRKNRSEAWTWLSSTNWKGRNSFDYPEPALPILLRPWVKKEYKTLFQDFLELGSLYDKPSFGDAVWTNVEGTEIESGWLPLSSLNDVKAKLEGSKETVARVIPQPARFNAKPISFILAVNPRGIKWPSEIEWKDIPDSVTLNAKKIENKISFSSNFDDEYRKWVELLAGPDPRFQKKNSADPENELENMADFLEEYYQSELKLKTIRQKFQYRGYTQSNVIAVIKGSLPKEENRPILFADHYDTAFQEDTFESTSKRVASHGANDNITATAALLMAGKMLKDSKPKHDIWLVHLTGEEYPADDLGARHLLQKLLKDKTQIQGLVLIDMIGYRKSSDVVFQVNIARPTDSEKFGQIALSAAKDHAPELNPKVRGRYDELSYLYNTDGYIFNNMGFPVVFFNEHLNRKKLEEQANPHYHQSTDVPKNVDFTYAAPISKTAIATLWELAN